jgi:hypothetical protein
MDANTTAGEIENQVDTRPRPKSGGLVTVPAQEPGWVRWLVWCAAACAPFTLVPAPPEPVNTTEGTP